MKIYHSLMIYSHLNHNVKMTEKQNHKDVLENVEKDQLTIAY